MSYVVNNAELQEDLYEDGVPPLRPTTWWSHQQHLSMEKVPKPDGISKMDANFDQMTKAESWQREVGSTHLKRPPAVWEDMPYMH